MPRLLRHRCAGASDECAAGIRARDVASRAVVLGEVDILAVDCRRQVARGIERFRDAALKIRALLVVRSVGVAADVLLLDMVAGAKEAAEILRRLKICADADVLTARRGLPAARPKGASIRARRGVVAIALESIGRQCKAQMVVDDLILVDRCPVCPHAGAGERGLAIVRLRPRGDDVDDAADRQIAPGGGAAAANNFHAIDLAQRHAKPLNRRVERIDDRHPIDQHQYALAQSPEGDVVSGGIGRIERRARYQ